MTPADIEAWHAQEAARFAAVRMPADVAAMLFDAAARAPDAVALDCFEDGETLTYRDLAARVRLRAARLRAEGLGAGSVACLLLPNGCDWVVNWMALAAIGVVSMPANVRYAPRDLAFVLDDSRAAALITDAEGRATFDRIEARPGQHLPALLLVGQTADDDARIVGEAAETVPLATPGADAILAIQFTSGTTGFPKGCVQTHRHWVTVGVTMAEFLRPLPQRVLIHAPLFYMDGMALLLVAFHAAATAFIAHRPSSTRFLDWIEDLAIDYCMFPEIVFKQDADRPRPLPLRHATTAGWKAENRAAAHARYGVRFYEAFGMTEVGVATYVPEGAERLMGSASCGIPSPFHRCKVVRPDGSEAGAGEPGELLIAGVIGLYYHNRPEATAATWQDGWFRTGDLFVKDALGLFTYSGRLKDMIKRSGENVAAQEVEAVLDESPLVAASAVIAVPDDLRDQEVKAVIVFADGLDPQRDPTVLDGLFAHCTANLAGFKVPRFIEPIAALPMTASEKVAKSQLVGRAGDPRAGCFDRAAGAWL